MERCHTRLIVIHTTEKFVDNHQLSFMSLENTDKLQSPGLLDAGSRMGLRGHPYKMLQKSNYRQRKMTRVFIESR